MKRAAVVLLFVVGVGVAAVLWGATSITTAGDIVASRFIGDGSQLTNVDANGTALDTRLDNVETLLLAVQDRLRDGIRFEDKGDGTVLDRNTGLYWLKDASCDGVKEWQEALDWAALLAAGQCGLTDGSNAGVWRLPTIADFCSRGEVEGVCPALDAADSLVNSDFKSPALSNRYGVGPCTTPGGCAFVLGFGTTYWSSSTWAFNTTYAWNVNINNSGYVSTEHKIFGTFFVWPVRGGL